MKPNAMEWVIEIESGINWSIICCCGAEDEARQRAGYFRMMQCFSGRALRVRCHNKKCGAPTRGNDEALENLEFWQRL